MKHFVGMFSALRDLAAHEHLFCSALQLCKWYELLVGDVKEGGKHEDDL